MLFSLYWRRQPVIRSVARFSSILWRSMEGSDGFRGMGAPWLLGLAKEAWCRYMAVMGQLSIEMKRSTC